MDTNKAQERLQKLWDRLYPDQAMAIKKVIRKPKSASAVGWTWIARSPDGQESDLGYTEKSAASAIKGWNSPLMKSMRDLEQAFKRVIGLIG